jgi:hypothetical protein
MRRWVTLIALVSCIAGLGVSAMAAEGKMGAKMNGKMSGSMSHKMSGKMTGHRMRRKHRTRRHHMSAMSHKMSGGKMMEKKGKM